MTRQLRVDRRKVMVGGIAAGVAFATPAIAQARTKVRLAYLHVVAVDGQIFTGLDRGLEVEPRALGLDSALVERLRLDLPMRVVRVAMDGEIRRQQTPLEYRLARGALNLVVPS